MGGREVDLELEVFSRVLDFEVVHRRILAASPVRRRQPSTSLIPSPNGAGFSCGDGFFVPR